MGGALSSPETFRMNDVHDIPVIGLGVYKTAPGAETYNAVKWGLAAGYRLIDTAWIYKNQESVGKAIRDSDIPRKDILVTTKFFPTPKHGYDECWHQVLQSMEQLGLEYLDLVLIHTPGASGDDRMDSWKALENLKDQGKVKSIGVSNYGIKHLQQLKKRAIIMPAVNQCEVNPYINRRTLHDYCRANGIIMMAYSPMTKGKKLNDPKLVSIAKRYNRTPAQILIRWSIDNGCVVIPKSSKQVRIEENFNVFDFSLDEDDKYEMDTWDEYLVTGWDPTILEV